MNRLFWLVGFLFIALPGCSCGEDPPNLPWQDGPPVTLEDQGPPVVTETGIALEAGTPTVDRGPGGGDLKKVDVGGQPATTFRFAAWADTKSALSVLSSLSNQLVLMKPKFTIYPGDMVSSWSDSAMNTWKNAVGGNKSNGLFDITFTTRGNHDATSSTGYMTWMAANHPLATSATAIGITNFTNMPNRTNQVYSFDYGNAHFVGLDSTGDADTVGTDQVAWLDTDLKAAEGRGLTHAFLFFHGPIYCVAEHCNCATNICKSGIYNIVNVLNKYPFVSATFHGHEHVFTYNLLDSKRDAKITHAFHQFVVGDAGAGPDVCDSGRYDYWMQSHGFLIVDVAGKQVTASFYKQGSTTVQKTVTWTMP